MLRPQASPGMFREPLAGLESVVPVSEETIMVVGSAQIQLPVSV